MLHKHYYRKCSVEKKILAVSLKGLVAKTNWLAVNRSRKVTLTLWEKLSSGVGSWQNDWEEMERKELGCANKTSCVIWSDTETVTNPLPGYD
jgi:hypothetical protein